MSGVSHGSLTLAPSGAFSYLPDEDYTGTDAFTYRAGDGSLQSQMATVTITVRAGCNRTPATIVGTPRADRLIGTPGIDVIAGIGGGDVIIAHGDRDVLCGGSGRDIIQAGAGDDRADGGSGDDTLRGDVGDDRLLGGPDADVLGGSLGNDALSGGAGSPDTCTGDAGFDSVDATCERVSAVP